MGEETEADAYVLCRVHFSGWVGLVVRIEREEVGGLMGLGWVGKERVDG